MLFVFPLLALAAMPLAPSAVLESPTRHVRSSDAYVTSLLRDGFYRSPTFARLIARLEHSDLIIHIETSQMLPAGIEGRLILLPLAHGTRYVRIQIGVHESHADAVALLAHELEHAQEVADAPGVTDLTALVALYERIGFRRGWGEVRDRGGAGHGEAGQARTRLISEGRSLAMRSCGASSASRTSTGGRCPWGAGRRSRCGTCRPS